MKCVSSIPFITFPLANASSYFLTLNETGTCSVLQLRADGIKCAAGSHKAPIPSEDNPQILHHFSMLTSSLTTS